MGFLVEKGIEVHARLIANDIPLLSALAMIWIAFLSPNWSDRMLWSAAIIFTAAELAFDSTHLFHRTGPEGVLHTYPRAVAVVGLVAYGGWLLVIPKSGLRTWLKTTLTALCVLAILSIVAYPLIDAYTHVVDALGAILLAGSLFALGLYLAERVGVRLLGRLTSRNFTK